LEAIRRHQEAIRRYQEAVRRYQEAIRSGTSKNKQRNDKMKRDKQ
jgi:hypothetical protein